MKTIIFQNAKLIVGLALILLEIPAFSQSDSIKANLSFDLGLTRDRNFNLWPVFKSFKSPEKKELQILYPIFSKNINYSLHSRHFHFFPFLISDSSKTGTDKRLLSFYYPSVFHVQKQHLTNSNINSYKFIELAPYISLFGISRTSSGMLIENNMLFFIWYKNDILSNKIRLTVFPLYWYFSKNNEITRLFLPIYYRKTSPFHDHLNFALIYDYRKSPYTKRYVLFPILWSSDFYSKTDTSYSRVLFPIYWSAKDQYKNNKVIFPLVYSLKNQNYRSFTVLPIFSTGHSPDLTREHFVIFPLYGHFRKTNSESNILLPLFWRTRQYLSNDTIEKNTLFPIYWSTKSRFKNNKVLFPLVYSLKSQEYHSLLVLPLFSAGHSPDLTERHLDVLAFFWHSKTKDNLRNVLFPVWWSNSEFLKGDTTKRKTFFPLYWSVKSKTKDNDIILPFVYSLKNGHNHSLTVFPFFSTGGSNSIGSIYLAVTPLYWHLSDIFSKRNILFPIWWSSKYYTANDTIRKRTFFPVYWSSKRRKEDNKIVFPLIFSLKNRYYHSLTVLPLFSAGHTPDLTKQHLDVLAVFWHSKSKNNLRNVLFPVWWSNNEYLKGDTIKRMTLFPLYWSVKSNTKDNDILFPLVYSLKNQDNHSLTVIPIFASGGSYIKGSSYLAITPLYWHLKQKNSESDILLPILWSKKQYFNNDTIKKITLFPVYWSTNSIYNSYKVLFPLIYSIKTQKYHSLTVLPLFSAGHSPDLTKQHLDVLAVFWHSKSKNNLRYVLFPVWWSNNEYLKADTIKRKTLFPLYWSVKSKTKNNDIIFPMVYSLKNQDNHSLTVFPFFASGRTNISGSGYLAITPIYWHIKDIFSERDILFPIFWSKKQYLSDDTIKKITLFPVFWSTNSIYKNNKVLFPLMYSLKNQKYHSLTVIPLFSAGHSPDLTKRHLDVLAIFWHSKSKNNLRNVLFPVWWSHSRYLKEDTIKRKTLFPLYWSVKSKTKNNDIIFPLVYSLNNQDNHSLTIFPFFASGRSSIIGSSYLVITPLYWHLKDMFNEKDYLFPIWWSRNNYKTNDTISKKTLFPVYWYSGNKYSIREIIFPIYWHSVKYSNYDTFRKNTIFPIYWSVKSRFKDYKIIFPLVYSLRIHDFKSITVLPLFSTGHAINNNNKYLMITPLVGIFQSSIKKHVFLLPIFDYKKFHDETNSSLLYFVYRKTKKLNYSETSVFWPICKHLKFKNYNYFRLAPIVWYLKTDTSRMFSIQPFQYSYRSKSKKISALFWILYKYENNFGNSVSKSILWKLYNTERFSNGDYEKRFLYLVYANINLKGKQEKSIFPFYHKAKYDNGNKTVSVFFSFYNYSKQYKPEIKEFYEEERVFWFIRLRSNYKILKQEGKEINLK